MDECCCSYACLLQVATRPAAAAAAAAAAFAFVAVATAAAAFARADWNKKRQMHFLLLLVLCAFPPLTTVFQVRLLPGSERGPRKGEGPGKREEGGMEAGM